MWQEFYIPISTVKRRTADNNPITSVTFLKLVILQKQRCYLLVSVIKFHQYLSPNLNGYENSL